MIFYCNKRIKFYDDGKEYFTITHKNDNYIFYKLDNDENILVLYSYDLYKNESILLTVDNKTMIVDLFDNNNFFHSFDIKSKLLNITLLMIEKYKDDFNINQIVLYDRPTFEYKKNKTIDMYKLNILLTGQ